MNKILIILIMIIFPGSLIHANVPMDWIQTSEDSYKNMSLSQLGNSNSLGAELFQFYELTGDLVSGLPQPNKSKKESQPWFLQSMGVDLGIEANGAIGLVGLGGEAAIEMVWARTKESIDRLQKKHYPIESQNKTLSIDKEFIQSDLQLNTNMSNNVIDAHVEDLMKTLKNTHNFPNPNQIKKTLINEISKMKNWVTLLEVNLPNSKWRPYKFQNLINLSAQGMVQPGLEVGSLLRLKLEWTLRPQLKPSMSLMSKEPNSNLSLRNSEFLKALSSDFEMLRPLMHSSSLYKLQNIKLGVGLGIEGDIGIAEGEAEVFGNLFWKEVKGTSASTNVNYLEPLNLIQGEHRVKNIPRTEWHKGLAKAMQISKFIVNNATEYEKKKMSQTAP